MPKISVVVQAECWKAYPAAVAHVRRAAKAALAQARSTSAGGEVTVALSDDDAVRSLNRAWRGRDTPTNVLSFPAGPQPGKGAVVRLGDVILAYETVEREAAAEGKAFNDHLAHLVVHGVLHLLGFDHETEAEAVLMEDRERAILATLGISDPYAAEGTVADSRS